MWSLVQNTKHIMEGNGCNDIFELRDTLHRYQGWILSPSRFYSSVQGVQSPRLRVEMEKQAKSENDDLRAKSLSLYPRRGEELIRCLRKENSALNKTLIGIS